jgi:hypothetical protein
LLVVERAKDKAIRIVNAAYFSLCAAGWAAVRRWWASEGQVIGVALYTLVLAVAGLALGLAALWTYVTSNGADRPMP